LAEVRALGEESLADSFDPAQSGAYDYIMRAWDLHRAAPLAAVPDRVDTVYVLSRVTLGADIKITSVILDAMKRRFPKASIVFVAGRKSIELFDADPRLEFLEAAYPRTGPVSARIAFGNSLCERLATPNSIVIDPDSRMTQLGLIGGYFHFPSRTEGLPQDNLTDLTTAWLIRVFGVSGTAYVAPSAVALDCERPAAAVSLGVGENESKRIPGDFEPTLIRALGHRYRTIYVDRGAGGLESQRVTEAAEASGVADQVRYCNGSFGSFVSVIAQSDFYTGYDSAGQHAAAAAGIPLISIFAGAPNEIFRARWSPSGQKLTPMNMGTASLLHETGVISRS
jgi:hypothetical protein